MLPILEPRIGATLIEWVKWATDVRRHPSFVAGLEDALEQRLYRELERRAGADPVAALNELADFLSTSMEKDPWHNVYGVAIAEHLAKTSEADKMKPILARLGFTRWSALVSSHVPGADTTPIVRFSALFCHIDPEKARDFQAKYRNALELYTACLAGFDKVLGPPAP